MNTHLVFPPNIRRAVAAAESEIGGLFLFEKNPKAPVATANALVFAEGSDRAVQFDALLEKFDDHKEWVIFHIHPPQPNSWNGMSSADLGLQLFMNMTSPIPKPSVFSMIFTPKTVIFTAVTVTPYENLLRIMAAFEQSSPRLEKGAFYGEMSASFFKLIELAFVTITALDKRSDREMIDNILDGLTFNPADEGFKRACTFLTSRLSERDRASFWGNPFVRWYFEEGARVPGLKYSKFGLFYSWVSDYDKFMETGVFILDDNAEIYNMITPWSNVSNRFAVNPELAKELFNEQFDTDMYYGGGGAGTFILKKGKLLPFSPKRKGPSSLARQGRTRRRRASRIGKGGYRPTKKGRTF